MEMLPALLQSKTRSFQSGARTTASRQLTTLSDTNARSRKRGLSGPSRLATIPMENNPNAEAGALAEFFAAER
jgi:hypothetical protein